jgi:homospermidine synthase
VLSEKKVKAPKPSGSSSCWPTQQVFNELAQALGVKVIHCSERDTQITDKPKQVDEFVNTWSIEGFREEGTTTAEMGWGTHEKTLPALAYRAQGRAAEPDLPRADGHEHLGALLGAELLDRGMVVRHGEAFTISDRAHRLGEGQGGLPADDALRLLPVRRGDRLAQRAARLRLQAAAETAHHERRDHGGSTSWAR